MVIFYVEDDNVCVVSNFSLEPLSVAELAAFGNYLPSEYRNVSSQYSIVLWVILTLTTLSSLAYYLKVYAALCGKKAQKMILDNKHHIHKMSNNLHLLNVFANCCVVMQFLDNSTRVCAGWYRREMTRRDPEFEFDKDIYLLNRSRFFLMIGLVGYGAFFGYVFTEVKRRREEARKENPDLEEMDEQEADLY
eukprot:CAMPEP_0202960998 /NCGR_PEP_ID=MMETSP1396-20130829/5108_1 /ASSEMBLY_ACC=CAM_ASM_000872 /TAXON_ID= /ORGANISM="Pseudokeronopsis sp., Strain Brazil" /LENGTH=191 /DNA_ID=CAMNT_0049680553 /DNA_START=253 /DNA_END=828 /DNA_ORIENTATION=+